MKRSSGSRPMPHSTAGRTPRVAKSAPPPLAVPLPPPGATTPKRRARELPWIRISSSGIHGRGVYARVKIPKDTRVIEYTGERITKAESNRREKLRLERERSGRDSCVTIFELNQKHDLDGRSVQNVARYINHSCEPNCEAEVTRGRIWIKTMRPIAVGEELTFDYGYRFLHWRLHPCRCGAESCAGYIVNAAQRWRVRREVTRARVAIP